MSTRESVTVAVAGYSSLDISSWAAHFSGPDATTTLSNQVVGMRPTAGGIRYLSSALVQCGVRTELVTWIGTDEIGDEWLRQALGDGSNVGIDGVSKIQGRSPTCLMLHFDDGGSLCFFTPQIGQPTTLSAQQRGVLVGADWIVLTVAPKSIAIDLLRCRGESSLVWAVKHDDSSVDESLARDLLSAAKVVTCNERERDWLREYVGSIEDFLSPGELFVTTLGADGADWSLRDDVGTLHSGHVKAMPVEVKDATGAGDRFVGTLVAALARSKTTLNADSVRKIVDEAVAAASEFLQQRALSNHGALDRKGQ